MRQSKLEILLDGNNLQVAPKANEIEISVFGTGFGECILLHLGRNNWLIVDSCVMAGSNKPAALQYLEQINVNPSESVKVIIATHWHSDHIKGLGYIFKTCKEAKFVCSDALNNNEFMQLISLYTNSSMFEYSGIDEFQEIIEILKDRCSSGKYNDNVPIFAIADRLLWNKELFINGHSSKCSLYSLSPCDAAIVSAKSDLKKFFPKENQNRSTIPQIQVNHAAVVLWITINETSILLGSDLEEQGNPYRGWSVIINSNTRPDGKAFFYKIPHHGSKNADHPDVWKNMLIQNPIAVLTPFTRGRKMLPSQTDIGRLCSNTIHAYTTSSHKVKKRKRSSIVEKTIKETVGKTKLINSSYGHLRFRIMPPNTCKIKLFYSASRLCSS